MVEHVHGGGKEHALVGLAGTRSDDFRQEGFADARIADDDDVGAFLKKLQIHQAQDAVFHLRAAFVIVELETIDRASSVQTRETEAALDGTAVADFKFAVGKRFQRGSESEVFGGGISQDLIQILAHRRQTELIQFLM